MKSWAMNEEILRQKAINEDQSLGNTWEPSFHFSLSQIVSLLGYPDIAG